MVRKRGLDSSGSGYRHVAGCCKTVMHLWVPQNASNFLTSTGKILLAAQEGLVSPILTQMSFSSQPRFQRSNLT
jgi:hypothetical protein